MLAQLVKRLLMLARKWESEGFDSTHYAHELRDLLRELGLL